MKKYGRIIRKSYFPNLFFKQNFRSAGQRKIHVSVHIKYAFHNNRFSKNFPLSYQKEKAHESSKFPLKVFPLKLKVFGLKPFKPANETNIFLNFISGKTEPQNLYRFTSPGLSFRNLRYPEPTTSGLRFFNFAPIRLINRELIACNLQPSNLRFLNPYTSESGYFNYLSANSTLPNLKSLKLNFFQNSSSVLRSKMGRRIQTLQNGDRSFLRGISRLFIQSRLPVVQETGFQRSGFFTGSAAYPLLSLPTASNFFRKVYNETLRKSEELKHSGRNILGRAVLTIRSSKGIKDSTGIKSSRSSEILLVSLGRLFNPESLEQKPETGIKKVKTSRKRQYSGVEQLNKEIWEKRDIIERKVEQRRAELPAFRKIQNINLPPSVQFLIQNFLEKTAFLLDYEYLTGPENSGMSQNIMYQQRKVAFPYSNKKIKKTLSTGRSFSAKRTVTGKNIPGKFGKNMLIFHKMHLKEDTSGLPALYIQQLTAKTITLIRNRLLYPGFQSSLFSKDFRLRLLKKGLLVRNLFLSSNNEILRADVSSYGAASTSEDYLSNMSMSHEMSIRHRSSERSFFTGLSNIFQKYPENIYEARTGIFGKTFASSIVETNKNLQSVFKLSSSQNKGSKILENTVTRIFNCLTTLTHNLTNNQSLGFKQSEQKFQPDLLKMTLGSRAAFPFRWQKTSKPKNSFFTQNSHLETKAAGSQLFSGFNVHRTLLTINKPAHTTGTFGIYGINMTGSPANIVQEIRFHSRYALILKTFEFPKVLLPSRITTIKGENPAYPKKIPLSREKENRETYTPEQPLIQSLNLTRVRIFKNYVVSKSNLTQKPLFSSSTVHTTGIKDVYSNLQQAFHALGYEGTRTFSEINRHPEDQKASSKGISTTNSPRTTNYLKNGYLLFDSNKIAHYLINNQTMEHKREKKREQEYSGPTIQIDKLQNKFILPVFLKTLDTIVYRIKKAYRFRKPEILPSLRTQNLASGGTKTLIFGLRKVDLNLRQNHIIQNTSVHIDPYPVTWASNSPTTSNQSYPVFFKYFSVPSKKEILGYSRIIYSTSGMNTSATTEQRSILSKIPNPILANSLLSNIFLSGMPSTSASILSLSKTIGIASGKTVQVYNLLKSTSSLKFAPSLKSACSTIFQKPVFAKKLEVLSNTETEGSNVESLMYKPALKYKLALRSKPASVSQFSNTQKPSGQKVSHWKTARISLSLGGEKRRSSNTETFLQKKQLDSLERKNNNLRVNKKIDIPAQAQMGLHLFLDFVHSTKPDFTKEMKRKKIIFTTYKPGKNPEKTQDIFDGFSFRSKISKAFEKTSRSRTHLGQESTDFVFSRIGGAGKPPEFTAFGLSVKGKSELTHAVGSNQNTGREDLVYETSEPLFEEVKKIKRIIFETREIVADHLESHVPQVTGTPEQVMDIEDMAEKVMQVINHRLKIEAERRGIF
ncbi:MAG: hypothetical protein PHF18_06030 [Methanosarcina sp.]|uniref:hypothetical protein n=1 Tax=Methanosarcina sp. TaxID=2213 RepID=UPI002615F51B|nr:hypothetical protein [Methanosarcina sp.]MDD3246397.1 hypothetical protein [Methanosarcina sp.]